MPTNTVSNVRANFCSTVSEASGEDPAGSSWAVRRMILIELPLPWPENSLRARNAPEGLEALVWEVYESLEEPWGFIGFAPDPAYSVEGNTRIFDLTLREDLASAYHRDSYLVPSADVVRYLRLLSYEPGHPDLAAVREPDDQHTRDFFICTHGSVDACCATEGYPIYQLMRAMSDRPESTVRTWRCTHFGGHRFAATALELPDGRYWARLKAPMLAGLVHRRADTRELRPHYRGWAALPEPLWQIAEAALLAQAGWSWTDATITTITGDVTFEDGGPLSIAFHHPAVGDASVDVTLTHAESVMTKNATKDETLIEAPQFTAVVTRQQPGNILDTIREAAR